MTKALATAALAGCLVVAPIAAEAAVWTPDLDTVIADPTVEAIFFHGDVILDGVAPFLTATGSSAAADSAYIFLDGGPQPSLHAQRGGRGQQRNPLRLVGLRAVP